MTPAGSNAAALAVAAARAAPRLASGPSGWSSETEGEWRNGSESAFIRESVAEQIRNLLRISRDFRRKERNRGGREAGLSARTVVQLTGHFAQAEA